MGKLMRGTKGRKLKRVIRDVTPYRELTGFSRIEDDSSKTDKDKRC